MTPTSPSQQPADRTRGWQSVMLPGAPAPKGAYSPAVRAGDLVFVSGQVPRDPSTGALVGDEIAEQTRQVMRNVERALAAADATLDDVVSVTVYLTNVDDWGTFDATYREIMRPPYPTRTAVGASLRGILVEISAVAYVGGRE
ncbi:Endoribonuclease L-PSP [Gemmatirosa kalamazoonensis]|uniref:Endoribonuclease L-PSP n=1 Tax=Gemmatirosa kalamazoonensis TaxID=861299 RepID=W0RM49_9BACT|nr:Rid family hydrolase [Gemmatirosa kalamazoonensis]AHG91537.1 Endoribonuclease L-PSP [Gemmatirosa kalamazoonensis]